MAIRQGKTFLRLCCKKTQIDGVTVHIVKVTGRDWDVRFKLIGHKKQKDIQRHIPHTTIGLGNRLLMQGASILRQHGKHPA
jgi:hypothetical protein